MIETQIKDSLSEIQAFAKNPLDETRVIEKMEIGEHIRQGDVYLQMIEGFDKSQYELTSNRQLAEGNTKGASHRVDEYVQVWKPKVEQKVITQNNGLTQLGMILVNDGNGKNGANMRLSHDQHAHFVLPKGTYQVSYQINPQEMARVLD